jgi:hypothetical protein
MYFQIVDKNSRVVHQQRLAKGERIGGRVYSLTFESLVSETSDNNEDFSEEIQREISSMRFGMILSVSATVLSNVKT